LTQDAVGAAHGDFAKLRTIVDAHPMAASAAMLGMTDVVKGMIAARPGTEATLGPHGITLLNHARAGGKVEGAPSPRPLHHAGGEVFHPAGAGHVNIEFTAAGLRITDGPSVVAAARE
jgi:hypothetical protein